MHGTTLLCRKKRNSPAPFNFNEISPDGLISIYHVYAGKAEFSLLYVHKLSSKFRPGGRIRLFAHYTSSLSSLYRCMWRYWTSKMLARHVLLNMWRKLSQFSQLSFMENIWIYGASCIQHTHFLTIVRILVFYLIIIIVKSKFDPLSSFRARSWNNGMRCMPFCILIQYNIQLTNRWW